GPGSAAASAASSAPVNAGGARLIFDHAGVSGHIELKTRVGVERGAAGARKHGKGRPRQGICVTTPGARDLLTASNWRPLAPLAVRPRRAAEHNPRGTA